MKPLRALSLLCALSMSSSCATRPQSAPQIPTVAIDPRAACLVWAPIAFSRLHDTEETIIQVKRSNAAHDAFCG